MASVVEVDVGALVERYQAARAHVATAVRQTLERGGATIVREMTPLIPVKTGQLRRSILFEVTQNDGLGELEVGVGTPGGGKPLVYARQREHGGTIRPLSSKKLAFPARGSPILTKAGVGGIRARDVFATPAIAGVDRVWTNKRGTMILGAKKGGAIVPLFVLRSQVTQQGSHFFYPTIEKNRDRIVEALKASVQEAVERG